jgi:hypothetical protein
MVTDRRQNRTVVLHRTETTPVSCLFRLFGDAEARGAHQSIGKKSITYLGFARVVPGLRYVCR